MIHLPTLVHEFNCGIPLFILQNKYKVNGVQIINILNKFTDKDKLK